MPEPQETGKGDSERGVSASWGLERRGSDASLAMFPSTGSAEMLELVPALV